MNSYEQKQEERKQRYLERAEKARSQSTETFKTALKMSDAIPFGQPILIGHHSEKRDRNYRNNISKTFEKSHKLQDKAEYYDSKAASVGTAGISSDDPDAISKIEAKLQRMISSQELMKTTNKAYKKEASVASLMATGLLNQHQAEKIFFAVEKETADFLKRPFPAFLISNNNANINRLKKRLEELKTKTARENVEIEVSQEITYREDTEENRIMFIFPGKPDEETRSILKRHAFRWSPSRGAWVRHLNNAGRFAAKRVIEKLNEESN